ncbi:MAG: helix-turn-helix domain-containing protein [Chloroflexi bacterium]|nr:helix-turn-helix domain-containing protein [Chloroflexota bacterium]
MTVSELSSKSGVPARRINEYEQGQRGVSSEDLTRLARALYVEEWDIKARSAPAPRQPDERPPTPEEPREARSEPPCLRPDRRPQGVAKRPAAKRQPRPPQPARASQLEHMRSLGARLGLDEAALVQTAGKPLAELNRAEASKALAELHQKVARDAWEGPPGRRKRPYLPESVDAFEFQYLTTCQADQAELTFVLFDGERVQGRVVGFSPYTITVHSAENCTETTLRKLAIAYYQRQVGDGERPR